MSKPLSYAMTLAVTYVLLAGLYIVISSAMAASVTTDVAVLRRAEITKGLVFVLATGAGFSVFSYSLLQRIDRVAQSQLQRERAFVEAQRRALSGTLAASIAHDFRNLLTVIQANLPELRDVPMDTTAREALDAIGAASRESTALVQRLALLGRGTAAGDLTQVDLTQAVLEIRRLVRGHEKLRHVTITTDVPSEASVEASPVLVNQMLVNLMLNAGEAVRGKGRIEVRVVPGDDEVVVEVHDDGPGVPESEQARIFEAFVTNTERGLGLGLLSVRMCAELHGGRVDVARSKWGGALFRVVLPSTAPELRRSVRELASMRPAAPSDDPRQALEP